MQSLTLRERVIFQLCRDETQTAAASVLTPLSHPLDLPTTDDALVSLFTVVSPYLTSFIKINKSCSASPFVDLLLLPRPAVCF